MPDKKRLSTQALGVVKSAARVLEVLEFMADRRRPVTVGELCVALGYPQSSTSVLLKSLQQLGYLAYDSDGRRYHLTLRVPFLGRGLATEADDLEERMQSLQSATDALVVAAHRTGTDWQIIHRVGSPNERFQVGATRPLNETALGHVLMAYLDDAEVLRIARRLHALAAPDADVLPPDALSRAVAESRCRRYALSFARDDGTAMVASFAPAFPGHPALAVGAVLPAPALRLQL